MNWFFKIGGCRPPNPPLRQKYESNSHVIFRMSATETNEFQHFGPFDPIFDPKRKIV